MMQRLLVGLAALGLILSACANGAPGEQTPPVDATGDVPVTGQESLATNTPIPNPTQPDWPGDETVEAELIAAYPNLLSELGVYALENENGENLGSVNGFVIDRSDGELVYVVVAAGGVLGVGQQQVLVPYAGLEIAGMESFLSGESGPAVATPAATQLPGTPPAAQAFADDPFHGAFVLGSISAEDLSGAPGYPSGELPQAAAQPGWNEAVRAYWAERMQQPESGAVTEGVNPVYLEQVGDLSARSVDGQPAGAIADLVIDPLAGRVTHVLFQPDAGLGLDGEIFVLPFETVDWQVGEAGEHWIVIDAAQLEGVPSISALDDLPDTTQENWAGELQ